MTEGSSLEDSSQRSAWKAAVVIVGMLWKFERGMFVFTVALFTIVAIIPAIQIYVTEGVINALAQITTSEGQKGNAVYETFVWITLQSVLLIGLLAITFLTDRISLRLRMKMAYHIEAQIADKAVKLPLITYDQPDYYDRLQRVSNGISNRAMTVIQELFSLGRDCFSFVAIFLVLIGFHWSMAIALLLIVIPSFIINIRIGQAHFWQMISQTTVLRKSRYMFSLLTGRDSAKEIRIYGIASYLRQVWAKLYWKNAEEQIELQTRGMRFNAVQEGVVEGALYAVSMLLVWLCAGGALSIGSFVSITQAIRGSQQNSEVMARNLSHFYQDALHVGEWILFMKMKEEEIPENSLMLTWPLHKGIEAQEITFQYPNSTKPILKEISVQIRPGQRVAIVGHNGAGKSTLVKCLIGLYTPQEGTIMYDGVPLNRLDPDRYRQRITAVFQDYMQYQLSVRENIGFGQLNHIENEEELIEAARKSGLGGWVLEQSQGVDTPLGVMFEGGQELSQGQWQKIALSRAFFRDAEIVVLDEPTASMDPMAEAELYRLFSSLTENKISLMVSHRLGSCKHADLILVLDQGRIIEQGNHRELMQMGGLYATMFHAQAELYYDKEVIS
ncbi:ABC transporter ATP-binding protein [Paenibacillus agilis]|uniref:ABC transporter ATP-binding protein n=1 Tax=Paenibacillus agilis TaxID=3020863 RepID=A0A559J3E2_9BACL|nr:ABC transporter ATP-binding protein [Paenibacillus agilis]